LESVRPGIGPEQQSTSKKKRLRTIQVWRRFILLGCFVVSGYEAFAVPGGMVGMTRFELECSAVLLRTGWFSTERINKYRQGVNYAITLEEKTQ
jgi:hypothetical protein